MTGIDVTVPVAAVATDWTLEAAVHILGFGVLACLSAIGIAFVYRGHSTRSIPIGGAVLFGVSVVAIWLNGAIWLGVESVASETVVDDNPLVNHASAAYLLGVFVVSTGTAELGRRIGDHLGCEVFQITRMDAHGEVETLLRSGGLVITVELPEEIADIDGYLPVEESVTRELAGKRVLFPHRLSLEKLHERLTARLRQDFDIDHVHLEVADDGSVDSLAIGSRPDGIGPTLPPGTAAVAIRGDPSPAADSGDPVEIWTSGGDSSQLVAVGTLRATVGDVATVTVDANNAEEFELAETYRLVMQPDASNDSHELLSVLWMVSETVVAAGVDSSSPLRGEFVGWLPGRVLVVEREDESLTFPTDNETLEAGDTVYVLANPAQLRRFATYDETRERERDREGPRLKSGNEDVSSQRDDETKADTGSEATSGVLSKFTP